MTDHGVKIGRERIVGLAEIAAMAGVQYRTAVMWRHRRSLPEPDGVVTGTPLWRVGRIDRWLKETGRLSEGDYG